MNYKFTCSCCRRDVATNFIGTACSICSLPLICHDCWRTETKGTLPDKDILPFIKLHEENHCKLNHYPVDIS